MPPLPISGTIRAEPLIASGISRGMDQGFSNDFMNKEKMLKQLLNIVKRHPVLAVIVLIAALLILAAFLSAVFANHDFSFHIFPWFPEGTSAADSSGALGQWFGSMVGMLGVTVTIIGFGIIGIQLENERKTLETQTSWTMYEASLNLLNTFIEHPELRKYFYENAPLPPIDDNGHLRSQVLAAAEIICDHLENIVNSGEDEAIDAETYYVWVKYMRLLGLRSQVVCNFLCDNTLPIETTTGEEIKFCEGDRYAPTFRNIVIKGILPAYCRDYYGQDASPIKKYLHDKLT